MIFSPQTFEGPPSVPARQFKRMPPQPIVPWTVARLVRATWIWLMAETNAPTRATARKAPGSRG
jgi:hypothetical protein